MSVRRHIHFGSTPSFNNLYKSVLSNSSSAARLAYANYDPSLGEHPTEEQKVLLQEFNPAKGSLPTLTFYGTEKLHGENMAVCFSQKEIWVQGRNYVRTLLGDQKGMAAFVEARKSDFNLIFSTLEERDGIDSTTHTIVLDCEWAGGNIQKGNAACSGADKGAYLFEHYRVVDNLDDSEVLIKTGNIGYPDSNIYNMRSFGTYSITLNFNNPQDCENDLKELALTIEENSPIAAYFCKSANVGEGAYLYCLATPDHPTYRLKTKGLKHGGKPKTSKTRDSITDELKAKLTEVAEKVTPVWRLTQAITETNSTERKHVGEVIKWVTTDVVKEDMYVLEAAEVDIKQLGGFIATIVKDYYFDYIKGY